MTVWYYDKTGKPAVYAHEEWIFDSTGRLQFHCANGYWYKDGIAEYYLKDKWVFSMSGEPTYYKS